MDKAFYFNSYIQPRTDTPIFAKIEGSKLIID